MYVRGQLSLTDPFLFRPIPTNHRYPEEPTLLKKAVKRITPDRTSYFHVSPKIDVGRSAQFKDTSRYGRNGRSYTTNQLLLVQLLTFLFLFLL